MKAANMNVRMRGFFRLLSYNPKTKKETILTDWQPNSMLLSGMNQMANLDNWAAIGSKCQVGTVSVPTPSPNDTQLLGYIDGTAVITDHTSGAQPVEPYYGWDRTTYEFPAGGPIGNQNLQEGGVGWSTEHTPPALITRALFTDGLGGNPTFTPLADEILRVQYELRYYPPLTDVIGTVVFDGVTYDTITRAALVTSWGSQIGKRMGVYSSGNNYWNAYSGPISDITQGPDGVSAAPDNYNQYNHAYNNNSFYVDMQLDVGSTGFNLINGIRSILISTNAGYFQTQFTEQGTLDGTIPKNSNYAISLIWRLAWSEAII